VVLIGMKAWYLSAEQWSPAQRGRELTVYIFKHHYSYTVAQHQFPLERDNPDLYLGPELEVYSAVFWFTFVREAERRLAALCVRTRGCADGDLPLPVCTFLSLRNEAFVKARASRARVRNDDDDDDDDKNNDPDMDAGANDASDIDVTLVYPPNDRGWNAAAHTNPFLDVVFFLFRCGK
jgi:hypothetical protein